MHPYPTSISYSRTPKHHQSAAKVWPFERIISGARYWGVANPIIWVFKLMHGPVSASWKLRRASTNNCYRVFGAHFRAVWRRVRWAWPLRSIKTFAGWTWRCTMFAEWRNSTADRICKAYFFADTLLSPSHLCKKNENFKTEKIQLRDSCLVISAPRSVVHRLGITKKSRSAFS